MNLAAYLKLQLSDIVDVYKKYYAKTLGTTIVLSLVTFAIVAVLFRFTHFDPANPKKQISLLSYIFVRYSYGYTYCLVDLSKTALIFTMSFFSIALARYSASENKKDYRFTDLFNNCKPQDFGYLIVALTISIIADFILFKITNFTLFTKQHPSIGKWLFGILYLLRIYIPLAVFSFVNYRILYKQKIVFSFKKIIFLLITLWLFNEFAYEFFLFIRTHLFGLILLPFPPEKHYLFESVLGVALISFYFVGYHSAMTNSVKFLYDNTGLEEKSQSTE